ncbi:hypothetical protein PGT21_019276 [Puccinia graminis f. sp. tritici]|uniref:Uncharacterized protein n=1 Tax=Puccinia graminis f. sp. tritici TaxID=56615 RepID=A0A5B0PIM3_PUCGR|nr:hypothetical protein PGTUg99_029947 [Puccinia graminis f. sp. tritici]KAA1099749.1 hypothetical protein PGT21_019276 [Puccinia graminis f. sp. tritici]
MNCSVSLMMIVLLSAAATMAVPFGYAYGPQYYPGPEYYPGFYAGDAYYGPGGGYYPYNTPFPGYAPYGPDQFSGFAPYGPGIPVYGRSVAASGAPPNNNPAQVLGRATLGTQDMPAKQPAGPNDQTPGSQAPDVQQDSQLPVGSPDSHGPMGVTQSQETAQMEKANPAMGA